MESLLDTLKWSVIAGVLALGLALLRPALEKRYRARWRYWLWLTLAVLALLAPVQWEKLLPAAPAVTTPVVIDVPEMELQVTRGEQVSVALRPVTGLPPSSDPSGTAQSWQLTRILPVVWLTGAAVFLLHMVLGTRLFHRKARRWSRKPSETTLRIYTYVWREMGLKKAPPLFVSSAAASPMLTGLLRPRLLLPNENWSERELSFILRHELTHYRRHDLWYKLVLLGANALHWFNPLMYLLSREASADLELTCDDAVVEGMDRDTRRAYSEALLSAIRRGKGPALSTHFYGGKDVIKERFRNILARRSRKWGALMLALTLLTAIASACTVGLRQTEPEPEPEPEPPPQDDSKEEEPVLSEEPSQSLELYHSETATEADLYRAVLLDGESFWDAAPGQALPLSRIKYAVTTEESLSVSTPYFAVVDLDGDGGVEVILWLRLQSTDSPGDSYNDVGSEVLHCINGSVYGYTLFTRQFNDLKTDGTFTWSGGASNNGYGTLTFTETGWTMNEADTLGDTAVTWYDFTPENIEKILGGI